MPLYPFKCPDCGITEDRIVVFEDRDTQVCEKCQRLLVRQMHQTGCPVWATGCPTASGGKATK